MAVKPLAPKKAEKVTNTLQARVDAGTAGAKEKARLAAMTAPGYNGQVAPPPTGGPATVAPAPNPQLKTLQDRLAAGTGGPNTQARIDKITAAAPAAPVAPKPAAPPANPNALKTLQDRLAAGTGGPNTQARIDKLLAAPAPAANPSGLNSKVTTPDRSAAVIKELEKRVANKTAGPNEIKRLQDLKNKAATASVLPDAGTGAPAPDATTPPPPDIIPNGMGDESSGKDDIGNALFPSMRAFEPENYEGSPMYKFQQQKGEESIRRSLAKRGLLDSGAEIEALADFNTELGAVESDKARGYADKEADRLERIQQNESLRRERGAGRSSDDLYRWTQMMLDQNPMDYAFSGTEKAAGNIGDSSSALAAYLRDRYPRSFPSGGGGGGGGGSGAYIPPFPTGPDFSEIDRLGSLGGSSSENSYWNTIKNTIAGLF